MEHEFEISHTLGWIRQHTKIHTCKNCGLKIREDDKGFPPTCEDYVHEIFERRSLKARSDALGGSKR